MKTGSDRAVLAVGLLSSLLVAIWAISSESLWIDEFGTWFLTRADSIPDWWRRFQLWRDSDVQIPLYHFFMYGWTKIVGTDVVAMRASNIGMFVIANLALLWSFRFWPNIAVPLIFTSCLSAPIWYYLNEIRPYIMLYMGTCLMLGASLEIARTTHKPSSFAIMALCIGAVISSGAIVIGIAWVGAVFLFICIYWVAIRKHPLNDLVNNNHLTLAITILCITALIAYNIRMFALGKLPALLGDGSILPLLFSFYANLGLLGVGPGMLDMRASGVDALVSFVPIITFSTIILGSVAAQGVLEIKEILGFRTICILVICIILPILFIFTLGLALHWRALPRHFIPLASLFCLLYAFGLARWWRRRFVGTAVALISVIILGYSSLSVRYAHRHAKDDYKHAAQLAEIELAHDGRVWWVADVRGAYYYGIPASDESGAPALITAEKSSSFLSAQAPPTHVLLSKPDAWDRENLVSNYLSNNKYHLVETFPAFTAWRP